jgi:hypothetical protein
MARSHFVGHTILDDDAAFAAADRLIVGKHFPAFPLGLFTSHPALGVCVARHCGAHNEYGNYFQDQNLIFQDISSLVAGRRWTNSPNVLTVP